jgi:hypothetical protein
MTYGTRTAWRATPVQTVAALVGLVFLLVGILGFVPGITTSYDNLSFAGHHGAKLLGVFGVNILHNIVHLGIGVAGLIAAARFASHASSCSRAARSTSSSGSTDGSSRTRARRTSSPSTRPITCSASSSARR